MVTAYVSYNKKGIKTWAVKTENSVNTIKDAVTVHVEDFDDVEDAKIWVNSFPTNSELTRTRKELEV